jgi:beta-carotene 3-hydroxylase
MELTAWLVHKYIMHGLLWDVHKDHHQPHGKIFQKNDLFFLIFAIPSWLNIMFGLLYGNAVVYGIGFGIAAYGLVYFLVHDVLIHRRKKWFDNIKSPYLKAVRRAHKVHHKNRFKEQGTCFGMLIFPRKHFKS